MHLREDTDYYCMVWLGMAILGAFYFSFGYLWLTGTITLNILTAVLLPVLGLPPVMVFLYVGYLRPVRGKAKTTMFGFSVVASLFYAIFSMSVPAEWGGGLGLVFWGIIGALVTAGGLAMIPPLEDAVTPGLLDYSRLSYAGRPAVRSAVEVFVEEPEETRGSEKEGEAREPIERTEESTAETGKRDESE